MMLSSGAGSRVVALAVVLAAATADAPGLAKPILPAQPDHVVGEKGVGPVDPEAVARDEKARFAAIEKAEEARARKALTAARYASAEKALEGKDFNGAVSIADQILVDNPEDKKALSLKERAQSAMKKAAEAAGRMPGGASRPAEEKKAAEEKAAQERKAADEARRAKAAEVLEAAAAALKAERFDEAEAKYNEVLSLDAESRAAQRGLKDVAKAREEAAEEARKAAERKAAEEAKAAQAARKAQIAGILDAGSAALKSGDLPLAESKFNEALGLDPENRAAQRGLKDVAKAREEAAEEARKAAERKAAEEAKAAEAARKAQVDRILEAADAALKAGELEAAATRYEEALGVDPKNRAAQRGLDRARKGIAEKIRLAAFDADLERLDGLARQGRWADLKAGAETLLRESLSREQKGRARDLLARAEEALSEADKAAK